MTTHAENGVSVTDPYVLREGIGYPPFDIAHREEEYDPAGFERQRMMQQRHFWYRGRHRFVHRALRRTLIQCGQRPENLRMIDLGGGCGGWLSYLVRHGVRPAELALADSAREALDLAAGVLPDSITRYQIDLLRLEWRNRWDVAFLLDVLEHIPRQEDALGQIRDALAPGGVLLCTTPALDFFWSYNDEVVHHVRRYSRTDFRRLADECGLELMDVRYFMFFLSPLLLAARSVRRRDVRSMSHEERRELLARTHRVPTPVVNGLLGAVFSAETPLGHWIPFPWGTSILAVLRKPDAHRVGGPGP